MKKRFLVFLLICSLTIMGCGNTVSVDSTAGRNETKSSVPSLQKTSTEEKKTSAEPTKDEWEGYQFAFSEKQGFGTYIPEDVEYEWDDSNGLTIYAGNKGYIPYVLMFRVSKTSHTPKTYFADYFTPSMQQEYGDRLVEVGETKEYSIGGKSILGTQYCYLIQDTEVILLRLFEVDNFGTYMEYTAKYVKGEGDETLAVLEDAVRNYTTEATGIIDKDTQNPGDSKDNVQKVIIEPPLSEKVKLKHYESDWHTMDYPEEWFVYTNAIKEDPGAYTILVQDPEVPERQIMINMGSGWFKSESAYKTQSKAAFYGSFWSQFPYLEKASQQCTAGFYECFNNFADSSAFSLLPLGHMNNFTVVENFGEALLGGDVLRGTYINDEGKEIQGIFMAHWTDVAKTNLMPGYFYSGIFYSAPTEEFAEWEPILARCLASLSYTDAYRDAYYKQEKTTMEAFAANTQIYNEISDMITSGWEARQSTYDLISEKRSDAMLGYDRVYDSETGEVYKTYSGFLEDYEGTRYEQATDDMYTNYISGYIVGIE